jgi:hypothetical protein
MVPTDPPWIVAFFEQCQTADKVVGVLDKLKEKKRQRKRKQLISLLPAVMTQTTGIIIARTATTIKVGNMIVTNTDTIVTMASINAKITPIVKRRTSRKSLIRREITTNVITSKRRTRSYTMTTPLL